MRDRHIARALTEAYREQVPAYIQGEYRVISGIGKWGKLRGGSWLTFHSVSLYDPRGSLSFIDVQGGEVSLAEERTLSVVEE